MDEIFTIEIPWQPPQDILVKQIGEWCIFSILDRFGRREFFQGRHIGYRIHVFRSRTMQSVAEFIVQGFWESAIYIDNEGKYHSVVIHGSQKRKETGN